MTTTSPSASVPGLRDAATRHLQALVRCDTQSPPGNEIRAAEYIRSALADAGIESEFMEAAPGRVSVVARLEAANPVGKPILLMGHIDVVTVEPEKWERDPFSGDLIDGFVWGRGAVDMKSQVAAELAAFIAIKEQGIPLARDLVFVAFADEEAGGEFGADYVWKHHQDLIDAEFAINEGGGSPVRIGGKTFYTCQVGEKGGTRLKMTVRGNPGHASVPVQGTAMEKLAEALRRLHDWEPPTTLTTSVRLMLQGIADALGGEAAEGIECRPRAGRAVVGGACRPPAARDREGSLPRHHPQHRRPDDHPRRPSHQRHPVGGRRRDRRAYPARARTRKPSASRCRRPLAMSRRSPFSTTRRRAASRPIRNPPSSRRSRPRWPASIRRAR